jgi:hypothetical protein
MTVISSPPGRESRGLSQLGQRLLAQATEQKAAGEIHRHCSGGKLGSRKILDQTLQTVAHHRPREPKNTSNVRTQWFLALSSAHGGQKQKTPERRRAVRSYHPASAGASGQANSIALECRTFIIVQVRFDPDKT